jgi:hypothetical protein
MVRYAILEESNISDSVVMIVCILFPPLLAAMIPYKLNQATKQLKYILKQ